MLSHEEAYPESSSPIICIVCQLKLSTPICAYDWINCSFLERVFLFIVGLGCKDWTQENRSQEYNRDFDKLLKSLATTTKLATVGYVYTIKWNSFESTGGKVLQQRRIRKKEHYCTTKWNHFHAFIFHTTQLNKLERAGKSVKERERDTEGESKRAKKCIDRVTISYNHIV